MTACINNFSHFCRNSELDHATLLIKQMTRLFLEAFSFSRDP